MTDDRDRFADFADQFVGRDGFARLNETTESPATQLAIDEALLLAAQPVLRFWEVAGPAVILGRSSRHAEEVQWSAAHAGRVPVLRRCTGGASVVALSGCYMYSVILPMDRFGHLRGVDSLHDFVMPRVRDAAARQHPDVRLDGLCDLVLGDRKVGGNALRILRDSVLYHGTLLYDADLDRIAGLLDHAPRQPSYRAERSHRDFIGNLPLDPNRFADDLSETFGVTHQVSVEPLRPTVQRLLSERYDRSSWHRRH